MPEGPSIVILAETVRAFEGRTIAAASGNSKLVPFDELPGQPILSLRSWGKHFLIELPLYTLRIHFLMFGSYRIDERKDNAAPVAAIRGRRRAEFLQLLDQAGGRRIRESLRLAQRCHGRCMEPAPGAEKTA
ncbi:DNA-formamidopyrimidine glycosylase family protein [Pseudoduganella sp. OTU4001]|uniref:DNA-formamidopyrimidine glycosylase family protein n=1 Tax=Pseudoduganella sp. OTU4001 TaxID=3043854 RepID=UPI00313AF4AD